MALEWRDTTVNNLTGTVRLRPSRPPSTQEEWFEFFDQLALIDPYVFQHCVREADSACDKYFQNTAYIKLWRNHAELYRQEKLS